MIVKLLTEHHLEFLSFKVGYTGSPESTLVKMRHCWKSRATAHVQIQSGGIGVQTRHPWKITYFQPTQPAFSVGRYWPASKHHLNDASLAGQCRSAKFTGYIVRTVDD